ncbi:MAG: hypothetical protein SOR57_11530 [Parabacteroides sp.]|nr:hypothetical protein [Parabacteroides sp.]
MREYRKYSNEERLQYMDIYMRCSLNRSEFEKENSLKPGTIIRWLRIFGLEDKPSPIMSKKLSKSEQELHDEIHVLEKRIKHLEIQLREATMERDVYNHMIDLTEEIYNIPVRKNSDAK